MHSLTEKQREVLDSFRKGAAGALAGRAEGSTPHVTVLASDLAELVAACDALMLSPAERDNLTREK